MVDSLSLPSSVRFLNVHKNKGDSKLWGSLAKKIITHLGLEFNSITKTDVKDLADVLAKNDTLLTLNLSQNPIGNEGATLLAQGNSFIFFL